MGIFGSVIAPTKGALSQLFADPELRKQVTYKRFDSLAFDSDLGYNVETYTNYSLYAIRLRHNAKSVAVSTAEVQIGEPLFMLKAEDAPTDMSLKDKIVADETEMAVKGIDNIFDLVLSVSVEGGGVKID